MGFSSLVTNYLGNKAQADATWNASQTAKETSDRQINLINKMYEQTRTDLLPFMNAGEDALYKLSGTGGMGGRKIDATGGAQEYLNQFNAIQYPDLPQFPGVDPTGGAQTYLDNLMSITFPDGVDPTGGMQKYIDQLEQLEFKLDENDPIYKWRASENERQVNQFMASRGKYDSRAAANMLLQSGMELQADEINRQYNQRYLSKYQQLTDLAQMSYQKGMAEYGAATDKYSADVSKNINALGSALTLGQTRYGAATDKYGADVAAILGKYGTEQKNAITGFDAAMALGGTQYNQLLDLVKIGTGSGQTAGILGNNTTKQLSDVYGELGTNLQNALLQQGALANQNWQNVGNSANNALSYYMMFSGGK